MPLVADAGFPSSLHADSVTAQDTEHMACGWCCQLYCFTVTSPGRSPRDTAWVALKHATTMQGATLLMLDVA